MRGDSHPINPRLGQEERFAQLGQPNGKAIVTVTEVVAGDIGVVTKLAHTQTGDTLCAKDAPVLMPPLPWPAASASAAIVARTKGDEDKIMSALARLSEEDMTFSTDRDPVTNEVLVHGLGDVHLDVALERMKRKFGVDAELHPPKIPYRETITGTARVATSTRSSQAAPACTVTPPSRSNPCLGVAASSGRTRSSADRSRINSALRWRRASGRPWSRERSPAIPSST